MPVDPNWTRWIAASLCKHFKDSLDSSGLPLFVEGQLRRTDHLEDYAELRYTGPRFNELSRGYWQIDVDLDVLIVSKSKNTSIFDPEIDVGAVLAAFTEDIPVQKYGNKPGDDPDVQLGCLRLNPEGGEIVVNNFGYPQDQVRLRQASVEATYRMNLQT